VSDTAFADAAADRSGPALRTLLAALPASPYTVVASEVVADEPREIQRVVQSWCEADVDLVLTTGGTGFGVRDRTPEVSLMLPRRSTR
jgi:gephyrin